MFQRNSQRVSSRPEPEQRDGGVERSRGCLHHHAVGRHFGQEFSRRNFRVVTFAISSIAEKPPQRHRQAATFGIPSASPQDRLTAPRPASRDSGSGRDDTRYKLIAQNGSHVFSASSLAAATVYDSQLHRAIFILLIIATLWL